MFPRPTRRSGCRRNRVDTVPEKAGTKQAAGQWAKGQSGNPRGRRPGTGEVAKLRTSIATRVPKIIERLAVQAEAGDVGAARLLLERVIPPLKASEDCVRISMPTGTLTAKGEAIIAAVSAGDISPAQGTALLSALGSLAKISEYDELAARVAVLEKQHAST